MPRAAEGSLEQMGEERVESIKNSDCMEGAVNSSDQASFRCSNFTLSWLSKAKDTLLHAPYVFEFSGPKSMVIGCLSGHPSPTTKLVSNRPLHFTIGD